MNKRFEHAELARSENNWKVFPGTAVGKDGARAEFSSFADALHALEDNGWEMVTGFAKGNGSIEKYFFKRPVEPPRGVQLL